MDATFTHTTSAEPKWSNQHGFVLLLFLILKKGKYKRLSSGVDVLKMPFDEPEPYTHPEHFFITSKCWNEMSLAIFLLRRRHLSIAKQVAGFESSILSESAPKT